MREEGVVLEDHADVALVRRQERDLAVAEQTLPASGPTKPASTMRSVVLPEPEGPSSVMNSPLLMSRLTLSSAVKTP